MSLCLLNLSALFCSLDFCLVVPLSSASAFLVIFLFFSLLFFSRFLKESLGPSGRAIIMEAERTVEAHSEEEEDSFSSALLLPSSSPSISSSSLLSPLPHHHGHSTNGLLLLSSESFLAPPSLSVLSGNKTSHSVSSSSSSSAAKAPPALYSESGRMAPVSSPSSHHQKNDAPPEVASVRDRAFSSSSLQGKDRPEAGTSGNSSGSWPQHDPKTLQSGKEEKEMKKDEYREALHSSEADRERGGSWQSESGREPRLQRGLPPPPAFMRAFLQATGK